MRKALLERGHEFDVVAIVEGLLWLLKLSEIAGINKPRPNEAIELITSS